MILSCMKNLYRIHDCLTPLHRKMYICLLVCCYVCPIWPSVHPLSVTYICNFFESIVSETILYQRKLHKFHIPNFISIFHCSVRLSKEPAQVRGCFKHFVASLFLWCGVYEIHAQPKAGGPPLLVCQHLLISLRATDRRSQYNLTWTCVIPV
jgi:hypothetical protein